MALLSLTNEKPGIYCLLQTRVTLTAGNTGVFFKMNGSGLVNSKAVTVKKKTQHQKGGKTLRS